MNKKYLFGMFAAAALFATSCSNDDIVSEQSGNYVNASFTIDAPTGINSRAIGDGMTANVVKCVVYDAAGKKMDLDQTLTLSDGKATYDIRLVKGQAYRVAFFAYNDQANAYDVTDMKNIQILSQASNLENRDAFTAKVDITAAATMNPIKEDITLYRPFAQLNLGALKEDITAAAKAGVVVTNTYVKVTNVYSTFSAYDDAVVGGTSEMEFALNGLVDEDLMADADGDGTDEAYEYLALNYLLVGDKGAEKALTDVKFIWQTADGKTNNPTAVFNNIPVQRNYRTNIIGWLLTNPAQFNIVIDAAFEKPDYNVSTWNGTVEEPEDADGNNVYEISTAAEFAGFAQAVNNGNTYAGKTVTLMNDIDLNNLAWSPIGANVATHPTPTFAGVFDGNGKIVSNLNASDNTKNYASAGLFGTITGEIKNLTVKNATVTSTHYAGAIVGYVTDGVKISNCHVDGATIVSNPELIDGVYDNGDKVGGIIGYANSVDIEGCTVKNTTIQGYRDLGGIVGYLSEGTATDCQVLENVIINVYNAHNYKNYSTEAEYDANSIVGEGTADVSNTGTATINYLYSSSLITEIREAALVGGTYTLAEDVEFNGDAISIKDGKDFTFEANGNDVVYTAAASGEKAIFCAYPGSTITVNADDNTVFEAFNGGAGAKLAWARGGTIIINGGRWIGHAGNNGTSADNLYASPYPTTSSPYGTLIINGGYFETDATNYHLFNQYQYGCDHIKVYGGTFVGYDPAWGDPDGGGTFVAEGYVSTQVGTTEDGRGIYTVTKK